MKLMTEKAIHPEILNLRGNKLTSFAFRILGSFLAHSPSLKSLSLEWNGMNDRLILAEFLGAVAKSSLQFLDLRSNKIGPNCADVLVEFVFGNPNLVSLDLSWNELGNNFGLQLTEVIGKNGSLLKLALNGNGIDQTYLDQIETKLAKNMTSQAPLHERLRRAHPEPHQSGSDHKSRKATPESLDPYPRVESDLATHGDPSRVNQNIYDALKNDIIRERAANTELAERVRELSARHHEDQNAREGAEMK